MKGWIAASLLVMASCSSQAHPAVPAAVLPSFVQYERVAARLEVAGDLSEAGVFVDHASALAAAPTIELSIDGPERFTRSVPLTTITDQTSRDGEHRWLVQPAHEMAIELGRFAKPGDYRVRVAAANVHIDPDHFRVVREASLAVVGNSVSVASPQATVARSGLGTFLVTAETTTIALRALGGATTRIARARDPNAAATDTTIAIAYATTEGAGRLALLDRALALRATVDLGGADATSFRVLAGMSSWIVAWTSNDVLTDAELDSLRGTGRMPPIDGRMRRVWIAEIDDGGHVRHRMRVSDGQLLAVAVVHSAGFALLWSEPPDTPRCLGLAVDGVRIALLDAKFNQLAGDEFVVGHCLAPAGAIANDGKRTFAAIASCDGDNRELVLLDIGDNGHVAGAKAIEHVDPGFDALGLSGEIWFAFAPVDDHVARRQIALGQLGQLGTSGLDAALVTDGHDEIGGVDLAGTTAGISAIVRSSRSTQLVELVRSELTNTRHFDLREPRDLCAR